VISRLRDLGLQVPSDVSVTGFDDIAIGRHTFPNLTTATSPRDELGRRAWALLHAAPEGRAIEESAVMLPARLVVRKSTAAPAAPADGGHVDQGGPGTGRNLRAQGVHGPGAATAGGRPSLRR
jgi:hypothetical protein